VTDEIFRSLHVRSDEISLFIFRFEKITDRYTFVGKDLKEVNFIEPEMRLMFQRL